jgi:acetolactate synthase-1/3 small subunit
MTVVVNGDDQILEQIGKQLLKLEDVREVRELLPEESVCRELILVKVLASIEERQAVIAVADIFRAKIVDVAMESLMIELTGNQAKIDAFIKLLEGFTIKEMVRTGITGLARGSGDIADYLDD